MVENPLKIVKKIGKIRKTGEKNERERKISCSPTNPAVPGKLIFASEARKKKLAK